MTTAADLRVPKQRVRVELCLHGRGPFDASLFLPGHDGRSWRRQDLRELLEGGAAFLPAEDERSAAFTVVARDALLWVRLRDLPAHDPAEPVQEDELFDIQRIVRVELRDGEPLMGDLLYSPPPGLGRVADHLNQPERFFSLWTERGEFLVQKAHVVRVSEGARASEA